MSPPSFHFHPPGPAGPEVPQGPSCHRGLGTLPLLWGLLTQANNHTYKVIKDRASIENNKNSALGVVLLYFQKSCQLFANNV